MRLREYAVHADDANMRMRMKISSTLSTYKYLPKMAIFWAKNGSKMGQNVCLLFDAVDAHRCASAKNIRMAIPSSD